MRDLIRSGGRFLGFVVLLLGIAALVLKVFFVDVVTVGHDGMVPTMLIGDRVLVWRGASLERNDIAVCRHPLEASRWVMGRVAAADGSAIELSPRGQLLIDGRAVGRDIRGDELLWRDPETDRSLRVRWGIEEFSDYEEHYFLERTDRLFALHGVHATQGLYLLSDNRGHVGEDSRAFGAVPRANCIGQVFMRLWPSERAMPEGVPHGMLDILD